MVLLALLAAPPSGVAEALEALSRHPVTDAPLYGAHVAAAVARLAVVAGGEGGPEEAVSASLALQPFVAHRAVADEVLAAPQGDPFIAAGGGEMVYPQRKGA